MADTHLSLEVSKEDGFDVTDTTPLKTTTSLEPFQGAGYDVPYDLLVLSTRKHRQYVPLSLLTRPAIRAYKEGTRPPLIDTDVKYESACMQPYIEMEHSMDYASWSSAMTMLHLILQQTMSPEVLKFYSSWLRKHEHGIKARLSPDSWAPLRAYDIRQRTLLCQSMRQSEAAAGPGQKVKGVKMLDWDDEAYDAMAAQYGTSASDLASIQKDGPSTTATALGAVLMFVRPDSSVSTTGAPTASLKGTKITPTLAKAIGVGEALRKRDKEEAINRLRASGRILSGAAGVSLPPSPISPTSPTFARSNAPQADPAVILARQQQLQQQQTQALLNQQARMLQQHQQALALAQKQQQANATNPVAPVQQSAGVPATYPTGTYGAIHPSGRLNEPSAVDRFNASKVGSFGACGVCGNPRPTHKWSDCPLANPRILVKMGAGWRILGTDKACCHSLNAYGSCTRDKCTYLHGCMACGDVPRTGQEHTAHGRKTCTATGPSQRILDLEKGLADISLGGGGGGGGYGGYGGYGGGGAGASSGGGAGASGGGATYGGYGSGLTTTTASGAAQHGASGSGSWGNTAATGVNATPVVPAKRTADGAVKAEENLFTGFFAPLEADLFAKAPILENGEVNWSFPGAGGGIP